jgi:hydroxymethylbilane synthase
VGQGAIAVQARADDGALAPVLAALDDAATRLTTTAERALLAHVEGGCQVPLGALGTLDGDCLTLRAVVADLDGRSIVRDTLDARVDRAVGAGALGRRVAERLLARGADAILRHVRAGAARAIEDTRS